MVGKITSFVKSGHRCSPFVVNWAKPLRVIFLDFKIEWRRDAGKISDKASEEIAKS